MTTKTAVQPTMSDQAVSAKTGKTWNEWFAILDKAGAKKMSHQEIVKVLNSKHAVGPWWGQMVTVNYERARGLRDKHEKPDGFQISVSRTLNTPLATLYKSFADRKNRSVWLDEQGLAIRKATTNKSMRVSWKDGKTSLEINFYGKEPGKSQVVVQHSKLSDAKTAARMKTYWSKALDRLRENLKG
jgi:hypothetical protein